MANITRRNPLEADSRLARQEIRGHTQNFIAVFIKSATFPYPETDKFSPSTPT
jgi:hypothetical protein